MRAMGVDFFMVVKFDRALAQLEAEEFVTRFIVERLAAAHVVTGYDFHFGHGRKGNPEMLRRLASASFDVTIVDQVTDDDGQAPFSSSAIRNELRHGRVGDAAHGLGYWWQVTGEVVRGDGRGAAIGFPTANIALDAATELLDGIYAVRVRHAGLSYRGAGYVGVRPTFDSGPEVSRGSSVRFFRRPLRPGHRRAVHRPDPAGHEVLFRRRARRAHATRLCRSGPSAGGSRQQRSDAEVRDRPPAIRRSAVILHLDFSSGSSRR